MPPMLETWTRCGEFLQARRARVRPGEVGLTAYGRRRVPGLRRDELARLAGVSVQYLTRLEQGVDRNPSPQVVDALATALRRQTLTIAGAEDQVIIVYQPEPGSASADALTRLL